MFNKKDNEYNQVMNYCEPLVSYSELLENNDESQMSFSASLIDMNSHPIMKPSVFDYRVNQPSAFRNIYYTDVLDELAYNMNRINPQYTHKHCYKLMNRYYRGVLKELAWASTLSVRNCLVQMLVSIKLMLLSQ